MINSIHPHRVIYPRFNGHPIDAATIHSIMTFFAAYILCMLLSSTLATGLGLSITDAITASIACLSNVGPAMGAQLNPSTTFANLEGSLHILFAFDMILGRLEIIPVLLCLTRIFWRA